ncbi:MAG TPA: M48 family metallopeptidase [Cytophagaceae bacterium]|jgi:Zn-dependent protease with chaperone function
MLTNILISRGSLFFALFIILYNSGFCQFERNYYPIKITDTIPADLAKSIQKRLESDKQKVNVACEKKAICKFKADIYSKRSETIIDRINDDYFIIDDVLTPYLQQITDKIYSANPQLKKEAKVYAFRSTEPNAVSFGDGIIAFNIGLLSRLESESQVAFILCHELAHYHLQHSDKAIDKIAALNFDGDLEKEIEALRKESYNKYSKIKTLVRDLTFNVTRHSRTSESEADSIGLTYLRNTSYNYQDALRVMEILDSCDVPLFKGVVDLKKHFDFPKYPFKDSWQIVNTPNFIYASEEKEFGDSDTASTHPDCKKRKLFLQRQLAIISEGSNAKPSQDTIFNNIVTISSFEEIESSYHFKDLGKALYYTLIMLEKYPDNIYLHAMIGKTLYQIYDHQRRKELGRVVSLPDKRLDDNYNKVLGFIHQLRLIELSNISFIYMDIRTNKFKSDQEFLYALALNSKLPTSNIDTALVIKAYKERFPKGRHLKDLN